MNVLVAVHHPAHVHFFKHAIRSLERAGHGVHVIARDKDIVTELLSHYGITYDVLVDDYAGKLDLVRKQFLYEYRVLKTARRFDPDVAVAIGSPAIAHLSAVTDTASVIFTDTEHARLQNSLTFPFADRICTPDCYTATVNDRHVTYPSYHELAYLHPNWFSPDSSILERVEVDEIKRLVIMRLVAWEAVHDVGDQGFDDVADVVTKLEDKGARVLITAETDLPAAVEHYRVEVPPHRIHDLMYCADLFIGESATMAAESAVLGTPAVFVSSSRRGYTDELQEEYGLVFNYSDVDRQRAGIEQAMSILDDYHTAEWEKRRKSVLNDKIATTEFVLDQIAIAAGEM